MIELKADQIPNDLREFFEPTGPGWIHRNELIWHKRDAMPSSATDRWSVDFECIDFFTKTGTYYFEQQFEKAKGTYRKRNTENSTKEHNVSVPYARAGNPHGDMRNARTVLDITTEGTETEHYASYPTRLVEIGITAGCPYAICDKCNKPKEKIFTKTKTNQSGSGQSGNLIDGKQQDANDQIRENNDLRLEPVVDYQYAGEKACKCGVDFHPGIVFDPFSGTGTTQLVAIKLDRSYLGVELQETYHADLCERLRREELKGRLW